MLMLLLLLLPLPEQPLSTSKQERWSMVARPPHSDDEADADAGVAAVVVVLKQMGALSRCQGHSSLRPFRCSVVVRQRKIFLSSRPHARASAAHVPRVCVYLFLCFFRAKKTLRIARVAQAVRFDCSTDRRTDEHRQPLAYWVSYTEERVGRTTATSLHRHRVSSVSVPSPPTTGLCGCCLAFATHRRKKPEPTLRAPKTSTVGCTTQFSFVFFSMIH
uniref:Putative secreted protein n=1 Tax=Anopheles marajoara TaxID=58244 RepID=A0A2M4C5K9_9DIPT